MTDSILFWIDDSLFYDFFIIDLIFFPAYYYFYKKVKVKLGTNLKTLACINKSLYHIRSVILIIMIPIIIMAVIKVYEGSSSFVIILSPMLFVIFYNTLFKKISAFNYNDVGIILPEQTNSMLGFDFVKWDQITRIKWDQDIKQNIYGFNIYIENVKLPVRCWIQRTNIDEINSLFKQFSIQVIN